MSGIRQTEVSGRRVAIVVAVLGALLFVAGVVLDLTRRSVFRHFYVTVDASALALFCVAAGYLRWGPRLVVHRAGRLAGRGAQVLALLACLSQAVVWVRVADRGDVWWALVFLLPTMMAAGMAIVAVQVALHTPRISAVGSDVEATGDP